MNCVELEALSIAYGDVTALDRLSLNIQEGMIYGIIGPDGAGKTSLMRSICTLMPYSEGKITVLGLDNQKEQKKLRALLGYMPQRFSLYQDLSVEQNIRFFGRLFGVSKSEMPQRMARLYAFSRLQSFSKRLAGALSGGMKQKLALSCALIHTPKLMVLDEPTFGVDPVSRQEFWQMLHELQAEGISIIVSTPYMDEAEQCDRISLLYKGKIMSEGTPQEILRQYPLHLYSLQGSDLHQLHRFLLQQPELGALQMFGNEIHLSSRQPITAEQFTKWQRECPCLSAWKAIPPTMEDIFLAMMQQ